jgi:hypothetical protein
MKTIKGALKGECPYFKNICGESKLEKNKTKQNFGHIPQLINRSNNR